MKKTIAVCDITGDEGNTLPIKLCGMARHTHLDAAGDTDEEYVQETRELDLSHIGALKLLFAMWEAQQQEHSKERWFDAMRYLELRINRAKTL